MTAPVYANGVDGCGVVDVMFISWCGIRGILMPQTCALPHCLVWYMFPTTTMKPSGTVFQNNTTGCLFYVDKEIVSNVFSRPRMHEDVVRPLPPTFAKYFTPIDADTHLFHNDNGVCHTHLRKAEGWQYIFSAVLKTDGMDTQAV